MKALAGVLILALAGCASAVPAASDEATFLAAGARRVGADEHAGLFVGNTLVGDGFRVYYAPNGTKYVAVGSRHLERRWRTDETGRFCEELVSTAVEVCADTGRLYERQGLYRAFRPDGTASPLSYRIVEGDARFVDAMPREEPLL